MIGQTIGHYRILRALGKGGMGEVYLAEDMILRRDVAVKVLPASLRNDPERLHRLRREAEAAASLKHPNIATIYALEEAVPEGAGTGDGDVSAPVHFIVMEYVEGETLSSHIPSEGMVPGALFAIVIPLADALAHAHDNGRIHRDIKPGNIMIARDGTPKILDFGLARIERGEYEISESIQAYSEPAIVDDKTPPEPVKDRKKVVDGEVSTVTLWQDGQAPDALQSRTQGRRIMGTPLYMSPEQVEHKGTDARTDLFSLGVVMYEALTGQRPFKGDTMEAIIDHILHTNPIIVRILQADPESATPYELWRIIRKCLSKDRENRYQTARDLYIDLQAARQETEAGTAPAKAHAAAPKTVPLWRQPGMIAGMISFGLLCILGTWFLKPAPAPPLLKFQIPVAESQDIRWMTDHALSPDGTMIAYVNGNKLWIRDLDRTTPREAPDSEDASRPFWSPQSDYLGYWTDDTLKKMPAQGGRSITILEKSTGGRFSRAAWGADGVIVYSTPSGLMRVSDRGGEPGWLIQPDTTQGWVGVEGLHFLPDGNGLLFIVRKKDGTYNLAVQSNGIIKNLLMFANRPIAFPSYSPTGHVLYQYGTAPSPSIWAVPFSLSSLTVEGEPFRVVNRGSYPRVSVGGTLLYGTWAVSDTQQLAWVDREGRVAGTIGQPQSTIMAPAISPDGRRIAFVGIDGPDRNTDQDIWIYDVERDMAVRLTIDMPWAWGPAWSPDGKQIAFQSGMNDNPDDIFVIASDGRGTPRPLAQETADEREPAWSPDGRSIVYLKRDPDGLAALWSLTVDGKQSPEPVVQTSFNSQSAAFSPDGRYVAYMSDESGRWEVYVSRYPSGTDPQQVSKNGGVYPRWGDDELFYIENNVLMAAPIRTRPDIRVGSSQPLFSETRLARRLASPADRTYDVSDDGHRFVVVRQVLSEAAITVVQNWWTEFEEP